MSRLFRKEVMEHQADRLYGEINLAVPVGWQAFGYLLLSILAIATIFLFLADYARVETVPGLIVPDKRLTHN